MISVVLQNPKTAGNIGAIARVMKNFNFSDLVLINPKCNHLGNESLDRATHAKDILKKAKIEGIDCLSNFDYVIGTTSKLGTDYNIPRSPLTPEQLAEKLSKIKKSNIAILFGSEDHGLSNKEILKCDFIVTIPASKSSPTMNISHSASIILYEIFKKSSLENVSSHIIPAGKIEKEIILKKISNILGKLEFSTKEKKETQKVIWKRIVGKSFLTKREAFALLGFLSKLEKK